MRLLRKILDKQAKLFEDGGKLQRFYPLYEGLDTFLYTPGKVSKGASHVRDALDLKRLMMTVVIALLPTMFMACYNTGYQAHRAIASGAAAPLENWQTAAMQAMGLPFETGSFLACFIHGALYFVPIYIVTLAAGGAWEVLFAVVRKHEINEGFLVTSALFPLVLPATIPLWQVALGISFGVVIGKEIFGGVGMNIWNPALMSRAFLYIGYPAFITGDNVWVAAQTSPDGYSGATWLTQMKEGGMQAFQEGFGPFHEGLSWWRAFIGLIPGSLGETSALACVIGAVILIATGAGSWRIMAGASIGSFATVTFFNFLAAGEEHMFSVPFWWHWVVGGYAFAIVYMATDPVSAPYTNRGRWLYGALIGFIGILIREVNPAWAGSWMWAILFMNTFSALIDHFVIQANVKRRMARYAA